MHISCYFSLFLNATPAQYLHLDVKLESLDANCRRWKNENAILKYDDHYDPGDALVRAFVGHSQSVNPINIGISANYSVITNFAQNSNGYVVVLYWTKPFRWLLNVSGISLRFKAYRRLLDDFHKLNVFGARNY
jgi:hypothetical protein